MWVPGWSGEEGGGGGHGWGRPKPGHGLASVTLFIECCQPAFEAWGRKEESLEDLFHVIAGGMFAFEMDDGQEGGNVGWGYNDPVDGSHHFVVQSWDYQDAILDLGSRKELVYRRVCRFFPQDIPWLFAVVSLLDCPPCVIGPWGGGADDSLQTELSTRCSSLCAHFVLQGQSGEYWI